MTKFGIVFMVALLGSAVVATLQPSRRSTHALGAGVAANERLTAVLGALLAVLVAAIGVTTLEMPGFLAAHYLVGLLLVPPLLLKLGTTGWRFGRYYTRNPAYRLAGPPSALLRWLVAPALVASSVAVFGTGIELWLFGLRLGGWWATAHTLSAVVFMLAIGAHLLGHLRRSAQAAADEASAAIDREVVTRRSLVLASLLLGGVLALVSLLYVSPFPAAAAR